MNKFLKYILVTLLVLAVFFKLYSIKHTSLDSDEVMWSVMADSVINENSYFWFFTDQNFRGSFETYFLLPFQYLFGVNEFTLRINSILFTFLTAYLIYQSILNITNSKNLSLFGTLIFLFPLTSIYFIYNKAWGGYVAIQFLMLLIFHLFYFKVYKSGSNNFNIFLPVLGLISGLSFWINEQSIYFIFILIFLTFFNDYRKFFEFNRLNKALYILFFVIQSFVIYSIIRKQMFLNLQTTFANKLGINLDLLNFNIYLKDIIYLSFGVLLLSFIFNKLIKKFDFLKSSFINYCSFTFIVLTINIHFNSFSRLYSTEKKDFYQSLKFLYEIILQNIFGPFLIIFLISCFLLIFQRLRFILKNRRIEILYSDIFVLSFLLFPLMFLLSSVPGLTETPRYLLLIWPISIVILLTSLHIFIQNTKFQGIILILFLFSWVFFSLNLKDIENNFILKNSQDISYTSLVKDIKNSNKDICVGSYWNIGLVFFYSNLEIKCFTSREYGLHYKFLDKYKTNDVSKVYIVN